MMNNKLYSIAVLVIFLTLQLAAMEQVSFDAILGAKRWDKNKKTWELAIGNPPNLFVDTGFAHKAYEELEVKSSDVLLLSLPYWPLAEAEFTCALEIEAKGSGMITMTHRNQRNSIIDQWDENFKGSGLIKFTCLWPQILMDKKEKLECRIFVSSSVPVKVKQLYIYQTIRQIFHLDTKDPVRGIIYNRLSEMPEASREFKDSLEVMKINRDVAPLIYSRSGGIGYGLVMPLFTQNGCGVLWRSFGKADIIVHANAQANEAKLYRKPYEIGNTTGWSQGFFTFDTTEINRFDAEGLWVGSIGEKRNQLASVRADEVNPEALLDFVAFIPQNRINLPANHKFTKMEFRYQDASGLWSKRTTVIPAGSKSVGLANRNPGIQVLWHDGKDWSLGDVFKVFLDTSLIIRENSIVFLE